MDEKTLCEKKNFKQQNEFYNAHSVAEQTKLQSSEKHYKDEKEE